MKASGTNTDVKSDEPQKVKINMQGADNIYDCQDSVSAFAFYGDRKTINADVGSKLCVSRHIYLSPSGMTEFRELRVHYVENGEEKYVDIDSNRDEDILHYVCTPSLFTDINYTNELVSENNQIEVTKDMDGKTFYSNYGLVFDEHGTVY